MRCATICTLVLVCLTSVASCRGQGETSLGFEAGAAGATPAGWGVPTAGWKAELTKERASAGSLALKLHKPGASEAPFGNVMWAAGGEAWAGRHVTLSAQIQVVGSGRGQMWLRVDRATSMGAFDNMGDRPIVAGDWKNATIEADIDPDAVQLNIGFMALGDATLFIDDVRLVASKERVSLQAPSPPRALTARGLQNLVAATRLLGYVRFFHPSDAAVGVASWDHVAVELMERAEPATDGADLAQRLQAALGPIAPTLQVWAGTPEQAPPASPRPEGATQLRFWQHLGAGTVSPPNPQKAYRSSVETEAPDGPSAQPDARLVLKDLGGGVSCRVPLGVFADAGGTLPHGATPEAWANGRALPKLSALNRSTRLAGVALAWSVFENFYPYFDVVHTDWAAALPAALATAATDVDERAYLGTLRALVARLHDGHGNVWNGMQPDTWLPLALQWAGTDLVVVGLDDSAPESLGIGDVVLSIDGRPAHACLDEVSAWISAATDGWRRYVSTGLLQGALPTADPAEVVVRRPDGKEFSVRLSRVPQPVAATAGQERPGNGEELVPGVVYFNLNGAETPALNEALPQLAAADAVIFDLRGYPGSAGIELMQHLIGEPATSARWCVPTVRRPDGEGWVWNDLGRWQLRPTEPRLTGRIAFLTDGRAISYAESIMGIVENYKLGEIIGATTAGTNGNVNPFTLPGGYNVSWTGMRVLKHDGSQHHGIGIAPTVAVVPTAQGIAEGRDEVLEKAVDVLQGQLAGTAAPGR